MRRLFSSREWYERTPTQQGLWEDAHPVRAALPYLPRTMAMIVLFCALVVAPFFAWDWYFGPGQDAGIATLLFGGGCAWLGWLVFSAVGDAWKCPSERYIEHLRNDPI